MVDTLREAVSGGAAELLPSEARDPSKVTPTLSYFCSLI
jgi:hypothetical protein